MEFLQQFFAEGPIGALLGLMVVPVFGAIALVAYLVLASRRGGKKTKMKLGFQPDGDTRLNDQPDTDNTATGDDALDMGVLGAEFSTDAAPKVAPAEPETAESVPAAVEKPVPGPAAQQPVELLRLLRHPESGQLVVEVAGKQYSKLSDITDKQVGQFVLKIAAHLLAFTNGVIVTDKGMKSIYTPRVQQTPEPLALPADRTPAATPLVPPPSPEAEAAFRASLQAANLASLTSQPQSKPSTQRRGGLFGLGQPTSSSPAALPTLNLVKEINEIVQRRLIEDGLIKTHRVDISDDSHGGIQISVNGETFTGPGDVADPTIQQIIKDSIKEWEAS